MLKNVFEWLSMKQDFYIMKKCLPIMLKHIIMKRVNFIFTSLVMATLLMLANVGHAQPIGPSYAWGKGITAGNQGSAYHVAMDKAPNFARVVQVGRYTDTLQAGGNTLFGGGMYINYSDTNGVVLWTIKEGLNYNQNIFGYSCPSPLDVEMMPNGDVVVLGTLCNDFVNDINGTSYAPTHGYFIAKYSNTGVFQWLKTYNVKATTNRNGTLEVSNNVFGNIDEIYVSITYNDTLMIGNATLTGGPGSNNAVMFALDGTGSELWVQDVKGTNVVPKDILYIPFSNLLLLADYDALYTPIGNYTSRNSAIIDFTLNNGSYETVKPIADFIGSNGQYFEATALDLIQPLSRIAVCGRFQGNVAIGTDTFNTTANGNDKTVWVAEIDTNLGSASFLWARDIPAPGQDYAYDVIGHGYNAVVAASSGIGGGYFAGDTIRAGSYLAAFSELGVPLWALQQPAGFGAYIDDIKPHDTYWGGNIYVGGSVAFEALFGNDNIVNPAINFNTVSQVSYLAKTGPYVLCQGFAAIAGTDTLISCQSPQQLVATHSLAGSPNYSIAWSPAQYLDNPTSTVTNVTEHVHLQTFTYTATDNTNGCVYQDSVVVSVYLPHNDTVYICPGDTAYLDMGPGATMYDWGNLNFAGPTAQVAWTDTPGVFWGVATYPISTGCGSLTSTFTVLDTCVTVSHDSVWPGDANSDGVADLYDVLNIGIGYNISGPVRTNASTVWVGQPAQDWNLAFLSGLNLKHADCDGNGLIDSLDVDVVSLNYGLTHLKTQGSQRRPGSPPIAVSFAVDTTYAPTVITADISLGDMNLPVTDGYGVAFSLLFDNTLVDSASIQADFNGSWLGNAGNPQSLTKNLFSQGQLDMAHTRTTQTAISGYGHIGTVSFYIQDNIIGKDYADYNFGLEIVGSRLISNDETEILLDEQSDSVLVLDEFVGINEVAPAQVSIYPNPGSGFFYVQINAVEAATVTVLNLLGEELYRAEVNGYNILPIDLNNQPNGIYLVKVQNGGGAVVKRLAKQ